MRRLPPDLQEVAELTLNLSRRCDVILASPTAVFGQPEINVRTLLLARLARSSPSDSPLPSRAQLGVIPGAGGTQRLTHALGKSRAMEIVLTGRNFSADEASAWGLVSRVVPEGESVVDEAVKVAGKIASKSRIAVQAAKEGVNSGASPSTFVVSARCAFGRRAIADSSWLILSRSLRALARAGPSPRAPPLPPALCDRASLSLSFCSSAALARLELELTRLCMCTQNDQKIGMKAFAEKQKPKWTHS